MMLSVFVEGSKNFSNFVDHSKFLLFFMNIQNKKQTYKNIQKKTYKIMYCEI